ncbi:mitochondrial enolase superfamily member 1 [Trichonephila inaurata madagascariensis]|uniref:Mitochondrial enolase superfamily member 1 n=1 Tax=Trichonephila inaurata madagascariensis TaxID=2747483 RepID=A0A8X6Y6B5_9ARAC|nr:mitochondrial enolase superfamily member 1 [Trichonephila inaurata madagascariensis]
MKCIQFNLVVAAVKALAPLDCWKGCSGYICDFAKFWRDISTSDSQLRWIGPEKGVIHLATAAVVNALWDLWARMEGKPVWKLLVDMTPEQLVSTIDFRYITDVITKEEAIELLKKKEDGKKERGKNNDVLFF